jgi:hypothetical protein
MDCNREEDEIRIAMAASHALSPTQGSDLNHSGHQKITIDHLLECAVALNWNSLTRGDEDPAMQVEYRTGSTHALQYLKLWSSTKRGVWNLICEYWMQSSATHDTGATFSGGWYSADLAWMLDAIMQHQGAFRPGSSDFAGGLIQINRPTDSDLSSAQTDMTEALDRLGSIFAERKSTAATPTNLSMPRGITRADRR